MPSIFSKKPDFAKRFLDEIDDNTATKSELNDRLEKLKKIETKAPTLSELSNGEHKAVNESGTRKIYLRIDNELWSLTATKEN